MPTAAGVLVGLVELVEGVVVRPVVVPVLPVLVPPPPAGGAVVPPLLWPMTAMGTHNPMAAAVNALAQIFKAMPPPLTADIIPPKLSYGCEQRAHTRDPC
jgi:hypothetical protein